MGWYWLLSGCGLGCLWAGVLLENRDSKKLTCSMCSSSPFPVPNPFLTYYYYPLSLPFSSPSRHVQVTLILALTVVAAAARWPGRDADSPSTFPPRGGWTPSSCRTRGRSSRSDSIATITTSPRRSTWAGTSSTWLREVDYWCAPGDSLEGSPSGAGADSRAAAATAAWWAPTT